MCFRNSPNQLGKRASPIRVIILVGSIFSMRLYTYIVIPDMYNMCEADDQGSRDLNRRTTRAHRCNMHYGHFAFLRSLEFTYIIRTREARSFCLSVRNYIAGGKRDAIGFDSFIQRDINRTRARSEQKITIFLCPLYTPCTTAEITFSHIYGERIRDRLLYTMEYLSLSLY